MASLLTMLSRFCYRSPTRPFFVAGLIFLILITWKFLVAQPEANALIMHSKSDKSFKKQARPHQLHAPLQSPVKKDEERKRLVNKLPDSEDTVEPDIRDKQDDSGVKADKEIEGETQDGGIVGPAQNSKQLHSTDHINFKKLKQTKNEGLVVQKGVTTKEKSLNIHEKQTSMVDNQSDNISDSKHPAEETSKTKSENKNDSEKDLKETMNKGSVLKHEKQVITTNSINQVINSLDTKKVKDSHSNKAMLPTNLINTDTKSPKYPIGEYNILLTLVKMSPNSPLAKSMKKFLKSVCRYTSIKLTLHAVVDDLGKIPIEDFFKTATGLCAQTQVVYHDVNKVVGELKSLTKLLQEFFSSNLNSYYNDPIFFMSTAVHRIFHKKLKKIIMMDVDLRFVSDIKQLFDMFNNFKESNIIGIAHEQSPVYRHIFYQYRSAHQGTLIGDPPPKGNPGYNSGVVLFNLENMRNSALYNRILVGDQIRSLSQKYHFRGHLGDQDFFTLLSVEESQLFYTIPCSWNRQLCEYWKKNGYADVFDYYANCSEPIHVYHGNCRTAFPIEDDR